MIRYVLDANALMTFFENRRGAERVEELLRRAEASQPLLLSVVNWGEVYYSLWRIRGQQTAREKLEEMTRLPIEVIDADKATTELAAAWKAEYNLPYVDSFAAALAYRERATLITRDKDFARVAKRVNILWTQA